VEIVRGKRSILGYNTENKPFVKVYLSLPTLVPKLKRCLSEGVGVGKDVAWRAQTYESNVPFVLRFMIDNNLAGGSWCEAPAGSFFLRGTSGKLPKATRCDVEIDVIFDSLIAHPCEGSWSRLAPLRVLATDIECQGRKGHFPEPEKDPVIQISCVVQLQGSDEPLCQVIFTLNGCAPISGAEVVPSKTEEELLQKWSTFIRRVDPDIITGYNTQNFDMPYLLKRAAALAKSGKKLGTFFELGRIVGSRARMRETSIQSAQMGKRENVDTTVDGRVMFDLLPFVAASCLQSSRRRRRQHAVAATPHTQHRNESLAPKARCAQVHVPQPQALVLLPEFGVCRVPGHAEGGRAPLDYLGAAARHGRRS
jgi:DNA polymerase delta subunit 1